MREIWPLILPPLSLLAGWLGRLLLEKRMRTADAVVREAEARKVMAEAEKVLAEADSEEARQMQDIISSWRVLYDATRERMTSIEAEQKAAREQYDIVLADLRWYKHGVAVLIRQIRGLKVDPEWTPDMPRGNGGK